MTPLTHCPGCKHYLKFLAGSDDWQVCSNSCSLDYWQYFNHIVYKYNFFTKHFYVHVSFDIKNYPINSKIFFKKRSSIDEVIEIPIFDIDFNNLEKLNDKLSLLNLLY